MVYKYHLSHPNDFTHKSILKIIILFDFWNKNIFRKNCSLRICMFKLLIRVPLNNIHELESATIIQTWIDYRVKFWTLIYVIKKSLEMQIYCLKIHNKCLRHLVLINLRNDHLCIYRSWYRIYRFNEFTYLAIFGQTVICFYIKEEKNTCYILCWFRANFQILNGEQTMTPPPFPKRTQSSCTLCL